MENKHLFFRLALSLNRTLLCACLCALPTTAAPPSPSSCNAPSFCRTAERRGRECVPAALPQRDLPLHLVLRSRPTMHLSMQILEGLLWGKTMILANVNTESDRKETILKIVIYSTGRPPLPPPVRWLCLFQWSV